MGRAQGLQRLLYDGESEALLNTERMPTPKFGSEAEEADRWFEHQDHLLEEFKLAAAEGRLGRGTAMRRAQETKAETKVVPVTIQLEPADEIKARAIAAKRGMEYEVFLGKLVHRELQKPEDKLDAA